MAISTPSFWNCRACWTSTAFKLECSTDADLTAVEQLELLEACLLQNLEEKNHPFSGLEASASIAHPNCVGMGRENSNAPATLPVFQLKPSNRKGEARELKLADISPHFGLLLADAATELGISKTSLQRARRLFGIAQWPGRKVRLLESALDRMEQAVVVEKMGSPGSGISKSLYKHHRNSRHHDVHRATNLTPPLELHLLPLAKPVLEPVEKLHFKADARGEL